MTNRNDVPTDHNRRTAERIRFAIRVRVNVTCEGMLVDLSQSGALLRVPRAQEPQRQVTVAIEAEPPLHLAARVVRCTPVSVETESATLARSEYEVAVEFLDVGRNTAEQVRRIIETKS